MIGETNEEEIDQDEMKVTNTSVQVEEDKEEQSATVRSIVVQTDDMETKESYIAIVLTTHNDVDGKPRVEVSLQKSKLGPSQSVPLATSSEE